MPFLIYNFIEKTKLQLATGMFKINEVCINHINENTIFYVLNIFSCKMYD